MSTERDDSGHFDAKIAEAVESVNRERTSTDEMDLAPAPEAPLELAEPVPKPRDGEQPGPKPEDNSPAERSLVRKRALIAAAVIVLVAAAVYVGYALTPQGSDLLPGEARTKILEGGDELERKAKDVAGITPTYYSFTDENGELHIVDDLEKVPPKLRKKAKVMR